MRFDMLFLKMSINPNCKEIMKTKGRIVMDATAIIEELVRPYGMG